MIQRLQGNTSWTSIPVAFAGTRGGHPSILNAYKGERRNRDLSPLLIVLMPMLRPGRISSGIIQ